MNPMRKFLPLSRELIRNFLPVALIPLLLMSMVSIWTSRDSLTDVNIQGLVRLLQNKKVELTSYLEERRKDAVLVSQLPVVIKALQSGQRTTAFSIMDESSLALLGSICYTGQFHDVLLTTASGDIIFSLARENDLGTNLLSGPYRDTNLASSFREAIRLISPVFSALEYYEPSQANASFISIPVLIEGQFLGVVTCQLETANLHHFLKIGSAPGGTGEFVAAVRDGEQARVTIPLRFDPDAVLKRRIDLSDSNIPIGRALSGETGSGVAVDYRDTAVTAAWTWIPQLRWGLVVKVDTAEIQRETIRLIWFLLLVLLITTLVIIAVVLVFSARTARPLIHLTGVARTLSGGELSVRANVEGPAEIAELSETFNKMARNLKKLREQEDEDLWFRSGLAEVDTMLRGLLEPVEIGRRVVTFLARAVSAQVGTIYLKDESGRFGLLAGYAIGENDKKKTSFMPGEGLAGQAALENNLILLADPPAGYLNINSTLGSAAPAVIACAPFAYNGEVLGVLELATAREFSELHLEFLRQAMLAVGICMAAAINRMELQRLLDLNELQNQALQKINAELQNQSKILKDSERKLIQQAEELQAGNEELEEQSQALLNSEQRLQQQQEELQVANEELENRNQLLEEKNRAVESARQELLRKAKELEQATRYKSDFLANMSHELRTPLNSLLLLARSLGDNRTGNLTDEQLESLQIIHEGGRDLLTLINEILDLSKIEAGRLELNVAPCSLTYLIQQLQTQFNHVAQDKGLEFTVTAEENLPTEITTDTQRLMQILRNLVGNALKFTIQGFVHVSFGLAKIETQAGSQALAIQVKDSGIGIDEDKQQLIFEAFQQADSGTSRRFGGTGLGLSISRELAYLLGGEIRVTSVPRQGTEFTVFLPWIFQGNSATVRKSLPDLAVLPASGNKHNDEVAGQEKVDILIIEDDARFARMFTGLCSSRGLTCRIAADGESGLRQAQRFKPDLILLDLRLPGISGWQVLERLKNDPVTRKIPVHIISGEELSIDTPLRGAVGILKKPVRQEDLETLLAKVGVQRSERVRQILLVEDDPSTRSALMQLLQDDKVFVEGVDSASRALSSMESRQFDCMIIDLGLRDGDGFSLLEELEKRLSDNMPPVIVYTAREITHEEEAQLRRVSDSIIIKGIYSEDRLIDEVTLFLHQSAASLPERTRQKIQQLYSEEKTFKGKKIIVVDDDMRTLYALARLLGDRGFQVVKAENGIKALDELKNHPDCVAILTDIMMPVMDGLELIRQIREVPAWHKIPVIALTAKAMQEDREKCLEAGASDYISKPVDETRLLSLLRVWLHS